MKYNTLKKVCDIKVQIEKQIDSLTNYMEDFKEFSVLLEFLFKEKDSLSFIDFVWLGHKVIQSLIDLDESLSKIENARLELNAINSEQFITLSRDDLYLFGFIESNKLLSTIKHLKIVNKYKEQENPLDFAIEYINSNFLK